MCDSSKFSDHARTVHVMFKHNDKLMSRNTIFWSRQDYLEIDYLERDYLERDYLEGDYLEKDYLERGYLEKDYLDRDYLGRDYLERDYLEKDYLESDSLRQIDRKLYLSTVTLIKNLEKTLHFCSSQKPSKYLQLCFCGRPAEPAILISTLVSNACAAVI